MSARRMRLELAPRARRDIRSIRLFGLQQWGQERADSYHEALTRGLQLLRDNPRLGPARDDLRPGLRGLRVEQHRILYRIEGDTVVVLRIVHVRQDAAGQLDEP